MTPLFLYLIKSALWLTAFFLVYKLLLQKETFHTFNRFFLITGMLAALFMPFVVIYHTVGMDIPADNTNMAPHLPVVVARPSAISWTILLQGAAIVLYAVGLLTGLVTTVRSMYPLLKEIKNHSGNNNLIFTQNYTSPFSFGRYIFIPARIQSDSDMQLILQHESVHTNQLHFLDLWLAKGVCILQFFNPLAWLYARAIQENCEFIADYHTIRHTLQKDDYLQLLVRYSIGQQLSFITLPFAFPLILKRLNIMKQKQSNKLASLKSLAVIPLAGLIMAGYAQTKVVDTPTPKAKVTQKVVQQTPVTSVKQQVLATSPSASPGKQQEVDNQPTAEQKQATIPDEVVVVGYGQPGAIKTQADQNNEVFTVTEELPSFAEGNVQQYIARNIKYPVDAQRQGVQGRVICQFIVEKDGSVSSVQVVKGVNPLLDAEACRVIYGMPKWNPGKQRGQIVRVKYTLPVKFTLSIK